MTGEENKALGTRMVEYRGAFLCTSFLGIERRVLLVWPHWCAIDHTHSTRVKKGETMEAHVDIIWKLKENLYKW